jgi:hypothetical protein
MSLVAAANVNTAGMGCIELTPCTPLSPGTYYIEVIQPDPWPSDTELYYSLFNHALAPNTGGWAADTNIDPASSIPLVEATPVNGTVYWPRDEGDYLSFSSDYYFLGDIYMVPSLNSSVLYSSVEEADGVLHRSMWIPGMGKTNSEYPLPPDDYFIHLRDARTWLYPINYSAVLYRHGPSMTVPAGHDTWATALELPAATGTDPGSYYVPNAGIDLQPGIQEVFFTTLTVPADRYLVGYYEIIGSRPHYRVRLGKIGPGGIPVWSPGINADSQAKVTIDMNYSYLSDAGTYFLKIEMLPSCPGKMRVFIDNNSRIAECASDDNNAYSDALDLGMYHRDYYHWRSGDMCPPDDEVDWYFFNSGFFDPDEGPKKNICLRGGAEGMRIELYNGYMNLQGMAETTSVGGYATIDLDGILIGGLPMAVGQNYYVKVMANSSEDRIQVYDLQLRNDLVILRPIWNFLDLYKVRLPYHLLENLES